MTHITVWYSNYCTRWCTIHMHTQHRRITHKQCERDKFPDWVPFYKMACILGIPRLCSAFYRLRRFLESLEHIYIRVFTLFTHHTHIPKHTHTPTPYTHVPWLLAERPRPLPWPTDRCLPWPLPWCGVGSEDSSPAAAWTSPCDGTVHQTPNTRKKQDGGKSQMGAKRQDGGKSQMSAKRQDGGRSQMSVYRDT